MNFPDGTFFYPPKMNRRKEKEECRNGPILPMRIQSKTSMKENNTFEADSAPFLTESWHSVPFSKTPFRVILKLVILQSIR